MYNNCSYEPVTKSILVEKNTVTRVDMKLIKLKGKFVQINCLKNYNLVIN